MTSVTVKSQTDSQTFPKSSESIANLEKKEQNRENSEPISEAPKAHFSEGLPEKKSKLTREINDYKSKKEQELAWAKQLNRWSIGIGLVLTAATTISSHYDQTKDLTIPLGTLAVTLNGWIASVPMSKRVALYERILVKADNLRSDLEFEVDCETNLKTIREDFKSLKVEFIQENPREQLKHPSHNLVNSDSTKS